MRRPAIVAGLAFVSLAFLGVSSAASPPLAGSLDRSFGSGGVVVHGLGGNAYPPIGGIAVQPDGKVVVAAGSELLARYRPNGSPDPSFGDGGYAQIHLAGLAAVFAVALQPDGKIVVAGSSSPGEGGAVSEFMLARYDPDGSLDTSFGTQGITTTPFPEPGPSWSAAATALAILPDGKIVAAGTAGWDDGWPCAPPSVFALARYEPDGTLDPTFAEHGIVQTEFLGQDELAGIAVQPDGKIVAGGAGDGGFCPQRRRVQHAVLAPGSTTIALARYKPDGSLDPGFGTGGKVTTDARLDYNGGPPLLQGGRILVIGNASADLAIARYRSSGRLDRTFARDGIVRVRRVGGTPIAAVAQRNGRILVGLDGITQGSGEVIRLLPGDRAPNGRLDPSFGTEGIVALPRITPTALALQANQKILVGGGSFHGGVADSWALARLIGGNNCVVPGVGDKTVAMATRALRRSYCRRGRLSRQFSGKVTRGRVIATAPRRGARLPGGARVDLVVSKGKRP